MTGNLGREGTGINPMRGQNNIQGAGDAGALPNNYPGFQPVTEPENQAKFKEAWGVEIDLEKGMTKVRALEHAGEKIFGMLICGENTNPLARFTLLAQGEQVHMATYPPLWPTHTPEDAGSYDLKQAILLRAGAHSFEGKVFNVVSSGFLDDSAWQELAALDPSAAGIMEASPRGVSLVTGPSGLPISKIMQEEEGLLYVDLDLSICVEPKQIHDVVGGYNRFDIFKLTVDRSACRPISFETDGTDARESEEIEVTRHSGEI